MAMMERDPFVQFGAPGELGPVHFFCASGADAGSRLGTWFSSVLVSFLTAVMKHRQKQPKGGKPYFSSWFQGVSTNCGRKGKVDEFLMVELYGGSCSHLGGPQVQWEARTRGRYYLQRPHPSELLLAKASLLNGQCLPKPPRESCPKHKPEGATYNSILTGTVASVSQTRLVRMGIALALRRIGSVRSQQEGHSGAKGRGHS